MLVGTAVGGMLFADRLATWYSQRPFHSWILRLQPDAEAGWDWAVVAVFGVVAVAASAAARYWSNVARVADRTPLTAGRAMSEEIRTSHRRTVRRLVIAGAIGAAISFVGVVTWMALSTSFSEVVSRDTAFVFAVVGPGLVLLSWGALNAAVLLAMGRPDVAVLAAWLGLLVDAAVALPLSAHADGWTASVGLLAGALVFLLVGLGPVRKVLRNADLVFATRA